MNLQIAPKKFVDELKKQGRSTSTIVAYGSDAKQFIQFLDKQKITQATSVMPEHIETFKKVLFGEKYSKKSISRKLNSVKALFQFLRSAGVIKEDPTEKISHPKSEAKPPRILAKMEYRALRDVARSDPRLSAIIELLLQTGMRIGELSRLEMDDIAEKEIRIKAYESHSARTVPLNRAAEKALDRYLQERPKTRTKSLFITRPGRPFLVRNIRMVINRHFRLVGIKKAKVNTLRHTFITHQLAGGVPVALIQKVVGHRRISSTEKYLELIKPKSEETISLKEL